MEESTVILQVLLVLVLLWETHVKLIYKKDDFRWRAGKREAVQIAD